MARCFFVSDLHGSRRRYAALFRAIGEERPDGVLLGGDLAGFGGSGFTERVRDGFRAVRRRLGAGYPRVALILGNDDPRALLDEVSLGEAEGLWEHVHGKRTEICGHPLYGYACIPPTPFRLKDWERYDVSRYVDPGCLRPEEGARSVPGEPADPERGTIEGDLERLVEGSADLTDAIFLFHSPPYGGALDRAALDGRKVDHAPVDVHVGSIAVSRFIDRHAPLLTLHGHVHESARLTGRWRVTRGRTVSITAAHDGPELALIRFDPDDPQGASRELL